jgi:hypothetical protein
MRKVTAFDLSPLPTLQPFCPMALFSETDTMTRETLYNVLTAVLIGLALCALVLHGLDALFL